MTLKKIFPLILIFLFCCSPASAIKTAYQGGWVGFDQDQLEWIADREIIVTTHGPNHVAQIRAINPDVKILFYLKFIGSHDIEGIEHLVLKDDQGNQITNLAYGWYLMDIFSQEWVDHLVSVMQGGLEIYDGVMLDDTSILWPGGYSALPVNYDPAQWYSQLQSNMGQIKAAFPGKIITFNGYNTLTDNLRGMEILDYADGISFEGFCRRYDGRYFETDKLLSKATDFYSIQKMKAFVEVGPADDLQQRLLGLSLFLLTANENAVYMYVDGNSFPLQPYPEYDLDLGQPTGEPEEAYGGLLRRYEQGLVFVNITETDLTGIELDTAYDKLVPVGGGSWENQGSLSWQVVEGTIAVPAKSGLILRNHLQPPSNLRIFLDFLRRWIGK